MSGLFAGVGIRLIDFKLEFGRIWDGDYSRIILADEISPDGCRLWDMVTNEKLDKDRFRRDLGGEVRSEEHTSELQSLMRISYAVFCLKNKTQNKKQVHNMHVKVTTQDQQTQRLQKVSSN